MAAALLMRGADTSDSAELVRILHARRRPPSMSRPACTGSPTRSATSSRRLARSRQPGAPVQYLNIGDPIPFGFSTPPALVEAVARAERDGYNGYVPSPGITEAREAVAADWSRQGFPARRRIACSSPRGTSEGIELALTALVDPGDAVLVPHADLPALHGRAREDRGRGELLPQGPVERLAARSRPHRVAHHAAHPRAGRHRPEQSHRVRSTRTPRGARSSTWPSAMVSCCWPTRSTAISRTTGR